MVKGGRKKEDKKLRSREGREKEKEDNERKWEEEVKGRQLGGKWRKTRVIKEGRERKKTS